MYIGAAKVIRKRYNIKYFRFWPLSSPDFNFIEKVWHWIKIKIIIIKPFPFIIAALNKAVQNS